MAKTNLSAERLRELLHYDRETGIFTRRIRTTNSLKVGDIAGCIGNHGYRQISVDGHLYLAHRLAWFYATGKWPAEDIDHINGCRTDNRIINLRPVTRTENMQNLRKPRADNSHGFMGVRHRNDSALNPWTAEIKINGIRTRLGRYKTPEAAHAAYLAAKRALHSGCTI